MFDSFFNSAFLWLFLALGFGCALMSILQSLWSTDHGLGAVVAAQKHLHEKEAEATLLAQTLPALEGRYAQSYHQLRKLALETITEGGSLMESYREVVQRHSRFGDIKMLFPNFTLPEELRAPEPPAFPRQTAWWSCRTPWLGGGEEANQ